jgi:hypothetical protein
MTFSLGWGCCVKCAFYGENWFAITSFQLAGMKIAMPLPGERNFHQRTVEAELKLCFVGSRAGEVGRSFGWQRGLGSVLGPIFFEVSNFDHLFAGGHFCALRWTGAISYYREHSPGITRF